MAFTEALEERRARREADPENESEEPIPPGDYTVVHGEDEGMVEVPTEGASVGEEHGFWGCNFTSEFEVQP